MIGERWYMKFLFNSSNRLVRLSSRFVLSLVTIAVVRSLLDFVFPPHHYPWQESKSLLRDWLLISVGGTALSETFYVRSSKPSDPPPRDRKTP